MPPAQPYRRRAGSRRTWPESRSRNDRARRRRRGPHADGDDNIVGAIWGLPPIGCCHYLGPQPWASTTFGRARLRRRRRRLMSTRAMVDSAVRETQNVDRQSSANPLPAPMSAIFAIGHCLLPLCGATGVRGVDRPHLDARRAASTSVFRSCYPPLRSSIVEFTWRAASISS